MNIRIVTASAGTGKTTRLAQLLDEAVTDTSARPEAILATTFTKQAAAELLNRARTTLLRTGNGKAAQALLTARIGTVNAVCGSLVTDFSFELGLSPELRVLDEAGAELELKRALASVVTDEVSDKLQTFKSRFDTNFDWHYEVRRLIEAARANGIEADNLPTSCERSIASLNECLGPPAGTVEGLDADLASAIDGAVAAIAAGTDLTKGTKEYKEHLSDCRRNLDRGRYLRWGDWASLTTWEPRKKSLAHAAPVKAAAARHIGHPRLREELGDLIRLMFEVAASGLRAYQQLKDEQGLLDFVDQEVWALRLLSRPDICELLKDELDLVLVDEFQDTSPLQLAIFLKLAELARQSVWVGDPKQAIYGFRGTDPALMDAAIESLVNPTRDPDLVTAAVDAMTSQSPVETLSRSYRSRPALVELTNAIFTRAFSQQQNMPEALVRIEPDRTEQPVLGPALSYWPLSASSRMNQEALAAAVATGSRDLLSGAPTIWDRHTREPRPATAADLAILCRTNSQCRAVSEALGQLGIASVVARVGLLDSAEAQVLLAGLRLWVDPRDALAAATLARILDHPDDAPAFVDSALSLISEGRRFQNRFVDAVLTARGTAKDIDVLCVLDTVADALQIRHLCAAWGGQAQRTANLDALRAHATEYCTERTACGEAPSLVGLLAHLEDLSTEGGWGQKRTDTTARAAGDNAVTVSTWHAAKGLEWPIVILFGLETVRDPSAYGVHVLSDRATFDVNDPLGGRWIHFWPNPYTNSAQNGPVKTAYAQSSAYQNISRRTEHEALRVLYVGWTRARDRLILAAQQGKLLGGLLGTLTTIDQGLIAEPALDPTGTAEASWAGHPFTLPVTSFQPAQPTPLTLKPGEVRQGRPGTTPIAAWLAPSSAPSRPARLREVVRLGTPLRMRAAVETEILGTTVHAFLAADRPDHPGNARLEMATELLSRHSVAEALEPTDLIEFADRLWRWVQERFGSDAVTRAEWPLALRIQNGTVLRGTSDLLVEAANTIVCIDHKSFGLATAASKVELLAGQLGCYADAVSRARPGKLIVTWLHLPFEGVVVELV